LVEQLVDGFLRSAASRHAERRIHDTMALDDIKKPESIEAALAEFRRVGRGNFLKKYGFGQSREYFLEKSGELFDSKAVMGAAHGYEFPKLGSLRPDEFSGGEQTVARKLRSLGFKVERTSRPDHDPRVSALLSNGTIYTREQLKSILNSTDATINTGVFRPAGFSSILLFITKNKTRDRTQYSDYLDGNTLHWQGQSSGRTDPMIIEHQRRGLEILVFYRDRKYEFDGAGFLYLGPFVYGSHKGSAPTDFTLYRELSELDQAAAAADLAAFDPASIEDARKKTLAAIVRRQGQPAFRLALLSAYEGRCAVTGCDVTPALEAAHIVPYKGPETNHVTNGLLLRADIHTLFDLGLIAVDERAHKLLVAPHLRHESYIELAGKRIHLPKVAARRPNPTALRQHRELAGLE
jgi:hypothetical protein